MKDVVDALSLCTEHIEKIALRDQTAVRSAARLKQGLMGSGDMDCDNVVWATRSARCASLLHIAPCQHVQRWCIYKPVHKPGTSTRYKVGRSAESPPEKVSQSQYGGYSCTLLPSLSFAPTITWYPMNP